jgi:hypothetical protein
MKIRFMCCEVAPDIDLVLAPLPIWEGGRTSPTSDRSTSPIWLGYLCSHGALKAALQWLERGTLPIVLDLDDTIVHAQTEADLERARSDVRLLIAWW